MANNSKGKNTQKKVNKNNNLNHTKKNQHNSKKVEKNLISAKESNTTNAMVMKILVFLGVAIFCFILIYLMYHFFVEKSDIQINMSTDKQMEYITIEGNEELIMTQKFVSDLAYSMRYDVNEFKVFKYKEQDIYKNLNDERILVVVEKSMLPSNCVKVTSQNEYNNCYIKIDNYTEYYYVSSQEKVYKLTIKTPGNKEYEEGIKIRINQMLKSFAINN